ncbi:MAG: serine/threonine protein phosphatase [Gammaproteobacteria bacterium]|nr:serine/threonine protein phosphatase [Gammaproteobacteria bacterium]
MNAIYDDNSLNHPAIKTAAGFTTGYYSKRARLKSDVNQDALLVAPLHHSTLVLAVADGVGGSIQGHKASRGVVDLLDRRLTTLADTHSHAINISVIRNEIIKAIEEINLPLLTSSSQTTLTLCVLQKDQYFTIQIGDSGMLHCGSQGKLKYRTVTQSPIGYAVHAGLLSEKEGQRHPDNNLVDNVIGERSLRIEIGPLVTLAVCDTILLASDGLFDNMLSDDIIETIRKGSIEEVCHTLYQDCEEKFKRVLRHDTVKDDDISFIVCRQKT